MKEVGREFLDQSRRILTAELLPRIVASVEVLSDEDLWWRPNDISNSAGNLVLHLAGNVRQWIIAGIGGAPDRRQRDEEFDERSRPSRDELIRRLSDTVTEAGAILDRLPSGALQESRNIQGRKVGVLQAVYHVVEHFSMHAGQIIYIAKLRAGRDLGFYTMVDGVPVAAWERQPED